jgi:predicted transcriptional regulator
MRFKDVHVHDWVVVTQENSWIEDSVGLVGQVFQRDSTDNTILIDVTIGEKPKQFWIAVGYVELRQNVSAIYLQEAIKYLQQAQPHIAPVSALKLDTVLSLLTDLKKDLS